MQQILKKACLEQRTLYMNTKYCLPLFAILVVASFTGCVTRSYYLSPLYGNASTYHTMPLQQDSVKYSLYTNAAFSIGGNNEDLRDDSYCFQGNIYGVHQFSVFKAWYGAGISLGNYKVSSYDGGTVNPDFDEDFINSNAGNKFFGSSNLTAGFSIVAPLNPGVEWRIIGISGTMQNEFGDYLDFRQRLAKTSTDINGLAPNDMLGTIGISSEMAFATRHARFSIQAQLNYLLGDQYTYLDYNDNGVDVHKRYNYVSNTFALTKDRITGFMQVNIGKRMSNFEMGVNYRLLPNK